MPCAALPIQGAPPPPHANADDHPSGCELLVLQAPCPSVDCTMQKRCTLRSRLKRRSVGSAFGSARHEEVSKETHWGMDPDRGGPALRRGEDPDIGPVLRTGDMFAV
eukprot:2044798-Rhodomonas_salina.1